MSKGDTCQVETSIYPIRSSKTGRTIFVGKMMHQDSTSIDFSHDPDRLYAKFIETMILQLFGKKYAILMRLEYMEIRHCNYLPPLLERV